MLDHLITRHFINQLKRLRKKFPHLKLDLINALNQFDPNQAIYIGRSVFKIRLKSRDQNKGKSGGLRAYIYLYRLKDLLVPVCIYPKSETQSITENELQYHMDKISEDLNCLNI